MERKNHNRENGWGYRKVRTGVPVGQYRDDGCAGKTWLIYAKDHLNTVEALYDVSFQPVQTYTYSAFGVPGVPFSVLQPYTYTAREWEGEGLMNYRNRLYIPEIGQFNEDDPENLWTVLEPWYDNFLFRYRYVNHNPVNYIDPFGERRQKQCRSGRCRDKGGDCPSGTWSGGSFSYGLAGLFFGLQNEDVCLRCWDNGRKFCFSVHCLVTGMAISKGLFSIGWLGGGAGGWFCKGAKCMEDLLGPSGTIFMSFGKGIAGGGKGLSFGEGSTCFSFFVGLGVGANAAWGGNICVARETNWIMDRLIDWGLL